MLILRELNYHPQKEYEYISSVPLDENGFTNSYFQASREDFEEILRQLLNHSKGLDLPPGYVPETHYLLWNDDEIIGWFRLRHYLNDALEEGAGHIGYSISLKHRGKGYATAGLALLIKKALSIVPEDKLYLRVNKDNPASLKVMEKNGGSIYKEDALKYYVHIPLFPKRAAMQPVIDRISQMETVLNNETALLKQLEELLELYLAQSKERKKLFAYYGSKEWFDDLKLSNEDKLPKGLRCGVLSEDAVYDLLSTDQALLEIMTQILSEKENL